MHDLCVCVCCSHAWQMNGMKGEFGQVEEVADGVDASTVGGVKRRAGWLDRWRDADVARKELLRKNAEGLDLTSSAVLLEPLAGAGVTARMRAYGSLLADQIWERSKCRWSVADAVADAAAAKTIVRLSIDESIGGRCASSAAAHEAYEIRVLEGGGGVSVAGASDRGLLFGVGRLLREMRLHHESKCAALPAASHRIIADRIAGPRARLPRVLVAGCLRLLARERASLPPASSPPPAIRPPAPRLLSSVLARGSLVLISAPPA
jgi:hypothetical protein